MSWGMVISAGVSLASGAIQNNQLSNTQDTLQGLTEFQPQGFQGPGGFGITEGGIGTMGQGQQDLMSLLQSQGGSMLQGGLFNTPGFQQAFQNNDIFGALNQSNAAFGQQAGNTAFGQLGNLSNQAQGLSSMFAGQAAGGPQDLSGGLMGQLFGSGFANQQASMDQSGLFNQSLATQRAAAQPQQDRLFNRLQDRQFAQGRLGSSGGAGETQSFFDSLGQQDLGFQNNAFGQAQQRSNFLGQLGSQQIGQGQGFLGQSMGQHNQNAQFAQMFGNQAAGLEGQQFSQMLQSLQQNQSAGNQRLQNAMGLFGQGNDVFGSNFGMGLQSQGQLTGINQMFSNMFLGQQNAAANRIGSTQGHADALASNGSERSGLLGGLVNGIGSMFSDINLKQNLQKIGEFGPFNWYKWQWTQEAIDLGISRQDNWGVVAQEVAKLRPDLVTIDPDNGYLKVNYKELF